MALDDFLKENGFNVLPIFDGEFHRFRVGGRKDKSGWYIGHQDGDKQFLVIGDWATGQSLKFLPDKLEPSVKKWLKEAINRERVERSKVNDKVAERAGYLLSNAINKPASEVTYLAKKGISDFFGSVFIDTDDNEYLAVPIRDGSGKLWSLQKIYKDGSKYFMPGGKVGGNFHIIQGNPGPIYICEGFSTSATVHMATGSTVICAFNAGNMPAVAQAIRHKYKDAEILICGDDDKYKEVNNGRKFALEARSIVNGFVNFPKFKLETTKPTDFNDLMMLEGLDEVRVQLGIDTTPQLNLSEKYPNLDKGFMPSKGEDKKKVPDYLGMANYLKDEIHVKCLKRETIYYYEGGKYYTIDSDDLKKICLNLTIKNIVSPTMVDNFYRYTKLECKIRKDDLIALDKTTHGKLNLANGVLDISTRVLSPHSPKYFFKYKLPYKYDPNAPEPKNYLKWLKDTFRGDAGSINQLEEVLGFSLTGSSMSSEKVINIIGDSDTGKSTALYLFKMILGDENTSTVRLDQLGQRFYTHLLEGKLANICGEVPSGKATSSDIFKQIFGKGDKINVEKKGQDAYDILPTAKFIIATNDPITFDSGDTIDAITKRILPIPFKRKLKESEMVKDFEKCFEPELSGILNRALTGFDRFKNHGFTITNETRELLIEQAEYVDPTVEYVNTQIEISTDPNDTIMVQDAYLHYKAWCQINDRKNTARHKFYKRFRHLVGQQIVKNGLELRDIFYTPRGKLCARHVIMKSKIFTQHVKSL